MQIKVPASCVFHREFWAWRASWKNKKNLWAFVWGAFWTGLGGVKSRSTREQHYSTGWGPGLQKKETVSWAPAFVSLCLWLQKQCDQRPYAPIAVTSLSRWTAPSNCELKQTLSSLSRCGKAFCQGSEKNSQCRDCRNSWVQQSPRKCLQAPSGLWPS